MFGQEPAEKKTKKKNELHQWEKFSSSQNEKKSNFR